jgi:hypothetical protein
VARLGPFDIDRVAVRRGEVLLVDSQGHDLLWVHDLEISVENVATRQWLTQGRPILLTASGQVGASGALTVFVSVDPFTPGVNLSGRIAVRHLQARELTSLRAPP